MTQADKTNKMERLKIIPSTMRENKRYILVKAPQKKIEKALMRFLGELGWAKANPMLISSGSQMILSINHDSLDDVRAGLELSGVHCIGVSGTIKKLKENFLK